MRLKNKICAPKYKYVMDNGWEICSVARANQPNIQYVVYGLIWKHYLVFILFFCFLFDGWKIEKKTYQFGWTMCVCMYVHRPYFSLSIHTYIHSIFFFIQWWEAIFTHKTQHTIFHFSIFHFVLYFLHSLFFFHPFCRSCIFFFYYCSLFLPVCVHIMF